MGFGEGAHRRGAQALLFEEFIAREAKAGRFAVDFTPLAQPILVHGHCHQKAFGAVDADAGRAAPDSGREAGADRDLVLRHGRQLRLRGEHYEVSMQMAEVSLLPAIRKTPEAIVVADGTSCRHQIADGAGREALHVARLLERCLPGASR